MLAQKLDEHITKLEKKIGKKEQIYNRLEGKKESIETNIKKKEKSLTNCKKRIELLEKVVNFFHETSEFAREQSKKQVERVVTNFLRYVFGSEFKFEIELEERGGRPWAHFYVISKQGDDEVRNQPQDSRGGGVVDVISLALRIAILQMYKEPKIDGPLILDEPAKHVSEEYIKDVTRFLKTINDMFNRQIIVVTHQQHLSEVADKAFRVNLKEEEGKSIVIEQNGENMSVEDSFNQDYPSAIK